MPRSFLVVRSWLFGTGLGAGVVGMALEWRGLVWSAAGLLAAAVLVRVVERKRHAP
ncbi:MAG: hypothetical protein ACREMJ_12580 [Gemmatimonadales bacterium]